MNEPGGVTWGPIRQYHRFPLVTFIIPSLGRESLWRAMRSLATQAHLGDKWRALVVFDGPEAYEKVKPWFDKLVQDGSGQVCGVWPPEPLNSSGLLRNYGLNAIENQTKFPYFNSPWVGFLDDDDSLDPEYVSELNEITAYASEAVHCVVFRMDDPRLGILPDPVKPRLEWGAVGISYTVKKWLIDRYHLRFIRENNLHLGGVGRNNDITFLTDVMAHLRNHDEVAAEWARLGRPVPETEEYTHPPGVPHNVYVHPRVLYRVRH